MDPDRDFFVRLPSFSLPMRSDPQQRRKLRDRLRAELPWLPDQVLDLRANTEDLKNRIAQAINTVLPRFDLVIVDEAHNLKHGWGEHVSSRNRVLATVLGRPGAQPANPLRARYGPRADKVLLISATPVDDDYRQLWNQLDVFGRADPFPALKDRAAGDEDRRAAVAEFLIRRVTSLEVAGDRLTKNLYRREWRQGGVLTYDEPIRITDDRQRLTVALVQKKVSELLGHERFGSRFQIGMLASFESFLQTTKIRLDPDDDTADEFAFDAADQTADATERQGLDVGMLNGLARAYSRRFGAELPHPKMDALAQSLASSWRGGRKGLVFVRRIASVDELRQKLNRSYDDWLIARLRARLAERHSATLAAAVDDYRSQSLRHRSPSTMDAPDGEDDDTGGTDTFFAWFFRGRGPASIVSGATIQERFRNRAGPLGTFFDDNHVMAVLGAAAGGVSAALATALGRPDRTLQAELRQLSRYYLTRAKQPTRGARFDAAQAAALELLAHHNGPHQAMAETIWRQLYRTYRLSTPVTAEAEPELLETTTFFTLLRQRKELRDAIWPPPRGGTATEPADAFREQHVRAQLLSAAARLGHAFIDLYATVADHLPTLDAATAIDPDSAVATSYLDDLQRQMNRSLYDRDWAAYDELAALAENHDLVLDTTLPDVRQAPLHEIPTLVGRLFGAQQPVGGMTGKVNHRLVHQFRLPGYPFVLISTDLLQEGEDLHTFCSRVYHYGLAWTPSATEQRTGRIDRVRSQTERRLNKLHDTPNGEDLLQVYYPHLADTVERLQVRRVMRRMNDFTRLMHHSLAAPHGGDSHLDISQEVLVDDEIPAPPTALLTTSFPVREDHLAGDDRPLAVDKERARRQISRFHSLSDHTLAGVTVMWERIQPPGCLLLGTTRLNSGRHQPFSLQLGWEDEHLAVRCISPVGLIDQRQNWRDLFESTAGTPIRVGVVKVRGKATYDVTVEEDVILTDPGSDAARVGALVRRVTIQADALEQQHLPDRDALLAEFRTELERDVRHAG
ncbi:helicase-related protein [Phytohabitans rumicis]